MDLTTSVLGSFEPSAEHARLREQARRTASEYATRAAEVRQHLLDHSELHPELWAAFCRHGWPGLLPSTADAGLLGMALVLEAFAENGIVLWMPALTTAISHAIDQVGSQTARRTWLPRVATGSAQLGMAATEPETGHNLFGSKTEITRAGEYFVVNGRKRVTSGLDMVDRVLVFGRAGGSATPEKPRFTTVLVDPRTPGVRITEVPMRFREGVRQFELECVDVAVPAEDLVGAEGQGMQTMWPFTHVERVLTAAICTGTAGYCLSRSVQRAKERVISGRSPIGAEQAIAHPIAGLHSRLEAVRLHVYRTASRIDAAVDGNIVAADTNTAKLLASDLAFDSADHAMQVFGADAWDEREGWLDLYLDARLSRSGPVSNEFALNYLAQHALGLPLRK
ncbi:acyl-CoA dehydrogenase family protein [Nocardia salmonicida]|uniref:acyl-CoA dehydrogenase family protein n=1 Tax=Nocardia salmonicida TaxID=53431 RepID=UPI0037B89549